MSLPRLVRNSSDLIRLVNEGYAVRIRSGHVLVDDVPFVTAGRQVQRGTMICPLDTQGDIAAKPANHVMWFAGGSPATSTEQNSPRMINARGRLALADGHRR